MSRCSLIIIALAILLLTYLQKDSRNTFPFSSEVIIKRPTQLFGSVMIHILNVYPITGVILIVERQKLVEKPKHFALQSLIFLKSCMSKDEVMNIRFNGNLDYFIWGFVKKPLHFRNTENCPHL